MSNKVTTFFADSQRTVKCESIGTGTVAMFSARSPDKVTVNEDAYAVVSLDEDTVILVVADGAGGHPQGDVAARLAIESLVGELSNGIDLPPRVAIINGFEVGHAAIADRIPGAATTLVVVEITDRTARTYHVGDSGAFVIGGRGKNKAQTIFHSPTGYAVAAGLLTENEAMRHDSRHLVSNIMGEKDMSVEISSPIELALRDTIVIASDGLFDNLLSEEIAALACRGTVETACGALVEIAATRMSEPETGQPSKPDDLTVLVYRQNRK